MKRVGRARNLPFPTSIGERASAFQTSAPPQLEPAPAVQPKQ